MCDATSVTPFTLRVLTYFRGSSLRTHCKLGVVNKSHVVGQRNRWMSCVCFAAVILAVDVSTSQRHQFEKGAYQTPVQIYLYMVGKGLTCCASSQSSWEALCAISCNSCNYCSLYHIAPCHVLEMMKCLKIACLCKG